MSNTYLDVPFKAKDEAKALGARWDFGARKWYVPECLLVIIGVTPDGRKELVTIGDGLCESKESWLDVLRDLARRGLSVGPRLAVGDGALGVGAG